MFRKGDEPIPGYRLEQFLGKGQFGEVWRSSAPGGTSAALKFIDLGAKQGVKELRGVQHVKEIRHANLMPITALWMLDAERNILSDQAIADYGTTDVATRKTVAVDDPAGGRRPEWLVVAMLLGKKNLQDRLDECRANGLQGVPVDELLPYMEEAAKGIDYLNSQQHAWGEGAVSIQHCDIKPANIMLIGNAAVVCDFGLARVLSDVTVTATGMIGSPAYMAPECIARKPGHASDQYSLAISYVELRTGELPFADLSYAAVIDANRQGRLDLSRLPAAEQAVIRKATSVDPDERYPSSLAMVMALRRAAEGIPPPATRPSRTKTVAAVAVLAVVLLPIAIWLYIVRFHDLPGMARSPTHSASSQQQAAELASLAEQRWETGDLEESVSLFRQAIQADPALEVPQPTLLSQHTQTVDALAATPDGQWLVSGGDDGRACAWRISAPPDAVAPINFLGHDAEEPIQTVAVSRDNRWAVTGSWDNLAMVWDLRAQDPSRTGVRLEGHAEDIVAAEFTPDSKWIVTASLDGGIRLWPIMDGKPSTKSVELDGHKSEIVFLGTTPDSRWLVSLDRDEIGLRWDLGSQHPADTKTRMGPIPHRHHAARISPNGKWLVTANDSGKLVIIGIEEPFSRREYPCTSEKIESMALDPQGNHIYVGDTAGIVYRYEWEADGQAKNPTRHLGHVGECTALAVSSDGTFCVSGSWDQTLRLWDFSKAGAAEVRSLVMECKHGPVRAVVICANDKTIAAATDDGTILMWNAARCRLILRATDDNLPGNAKGFHTQRQTTTPGFVKAH